jgi:hypothetical protein
VRFGRRQKMSKSGQPNKEDRRSEIGDRKRAIKIPGARGKPAF